jgi:hypothetical protein
MTGEICQRGGTELFKIKNGDAERRLRKNRIGKNYLIKIIFFVEVKFPAVNV